MEFNTKLVPNSSSGWLAVLAGWLAVLAGWLRLLLDLFFNSVRKVPGHFPTELPLARSILWENSQGIFPQNCLVLAEDTSIPLAEGWQWNGNGFCGKTSGKFPDRID